MPVNRLSPAYHTIQAVIESVYVTLHGQLAEPFRVMLSHYAEDKNHWQCVVNFNSDLLPYQKGSRTYSVATVRLEHHELLVRSWTQRVPRELPCTSAWQLEDPACFDFVVGEVFEVCLDFCRVQYKRAIKDRACPRKRALKEMLDNLSDRLQRQRKNWRSAHANDIHEGTVRILS